MVTLTDLFPAGALDDALAAGHVRLQSHPELPLAIYNYTERCAAWTPPTGHTVLFEIIYPENRIVVDYGEMENLVLRGAVHTATGGSLAPRQVGWPGPVVETFAYPTFGAALAAPPRDNREGLVVHALASGERVKLKYEEYLRLHRIVTGLTARTVWEAIVAGDTVAQICEPLPDEFQPWARAVAERLAAEVDAAAAEVERAFAQILADLPDGHTRKDFALVAARHPLRGLLFARLDGKDFRPALWQQAKPEAGETPHGRSFDDE